MPFHALMALENAITQRMMRGDPYLFLQKPETWFNHVQETKKDQGRAFGHTGIVAAASAVLADLEKGGILKVGGTPLAIALYRSTHCVISCVYLLEEVCRCPQTK